MLGKFRLLKPTFGVFASNHARAVIPEGATVEIYLSPLVGDRLADVIWDGNVMMMFVADILSRAKQIETTRSATGCSVHSQLMSEFLKQVDEYHKAVIEVIDLTGTATETPVTKTLYQRCIATRNEVRRHESEHGCSAATARTRS